MPPKIKIEKEELLEAAFQLVKENGIEKLNARDLAKKCNCSVHPIFRTFQSMEGLKEAIYKKTEELYNDRMLNNQRNPEEGFLSFGLNYIDFAKNEKNLFKLLFMTDAFKEQSIMDIVGNTQGDDEIIHMLCQRTGLCEASAKELYAGIWITTHGIAAMFATNNCRFSDEENRRLLNNSFMGLILKLKNEENK